MKAKIIGKNNQEKSIELPAFFNEKIRNDLAQRLLEVKRFEEMQPRGADVMAGKMHSASGIISHRRRKWKTAYGHGISRVPRKIFWRRGTQFYWVGAFVSNTRGGRRPHAPLVEHFMTTKKVNKKEMIIALKSAFASTANNEMIKERYQTLKDKEIKNMPIVISEEVLSMKTKEFLGFLKENMKGMEELISKNKKVRAGRGKLRNRKYKKSAGVLLIIGREEEKKISGMDVRNINTIRIQDLMPLGRMTIYTEKALKELSEVIG